MALSEKNEVFQLELQESSSQLACATQLIITLLRWVDPWILQTYNDIVVYVTDLLSKHSILYGTLMLLVVMLVVVARRWTATTCNVILAGALLYYLHLVCKSLGEPSLILTNIREEN